MTLQDLENLTYLWLREPEYIDPAGVARANPGVGAQFPLWALDRDLSHAVSIFVSRVGMAPDLTDKMATLAIVAGLDYALPADLVALDRVEYTVAGANYPTLLQACSFDEFDIVTGNGLALNANGYPIYFRKPFGVPGSTLSIRFYPAPDADNVTAGDTVTLYYVSNGGVLVNATDTPPFPPQYHEAPVCYVLSRYWRIKQDLEMAASFMQDFERHVKDAKAFGDSVNNTRQDSVGEDVDVSSGYGLSSMG